MVGGSVSVTTTAETVVVTSAPTSTEATEGVVAIEGVIDLTVGTGGLTATLNIRRGTTAGGTLVQSIGPLTVVAANRYQASIVAVDRPGIVTGLQYCLTVTVGSASGNSTANYSSIQTQAQGAA
jgi:hypothetical protein